MAVSSLSEGTIDACSCFAIRSLEHEPLAFLCRCLHARTLEEFIRPQLGRRPGPYSMPLHDLQAPLPFASFSPACGPRSLEQDVHSCRAGACTDAGPTTSCSHARLPFLSPKWGKLTRQIGLDSRCGFNALHRPQGDPD